MSLLAKIAGIRSSRRLPVLLAISLYTALPPATSAQRHPESSGPLPYYNTDPGTPREPEWKQRPPFLRGPQDRYQRGLGRTFLNAEDSVPYKNYADQRYILYFRDFLWNEIKGTGRPLSTRNVRWDRMGNFMGGNYQRVLNIEESRSGSDFSGYSYIDHKFLLFNIGHYTYKDLHWTATIGNVASAGGGSQVRTIFTPLTLASSLLNTARMDLNYKERDRATLFYSRGGEQGSALLFSKWTAGAGDHTFFNSPVLLFGGHWQHEIGRFANFGASLVNQIMSSPGLSRTSAWRGDMPYDMLGPKTIRVFVADDSPDETRTKAISYGMDIIIKGEREGQRVRLTSLNNDPDYDSSLEAGPPEGGLLRADGGLEAEGKMPVVYTFALPPDVTVRSTRFVADVAGDYRLGVSQTHDMFNIDRNGSGAISEMVWPAPIISAADAATRRPFKWYADEGEELYYTVARSQGDNGSASNRRSVNFDYGIPTGQSLASVNWRTELVGLELSGEVAHNLQNFIFPIGNNEGDRNSERAWAWWLKGIKDVVGGLALGGEVYRMEPDYAGGYDSYRGGMAFHVDQQNTPGARVETATQEFPIHDDNDDHDRFPDDHRNDSAIAEPRALYPGFPNAQVYPGLDENVDNIPDVDRNENFVVDWEEPFLTYDSEPPEFVYGIDFNNNNVPDYRENDDRPDYPYPRDQQGQHVFLRYDNLGKFGDFISVGRYDNSQIVGGGEAESIYFRYAYSVAKRGVGELKINFDAKKVKDDIPDHTFIYSVPPDDIEFINWANRPDGPPNSEGFQRPATPDGLLMRDSFVNLAFINGQYLGFRRIHIEHGLLWARNSQAAIALVQPSDVRSRISVVNKVDYTWTRGSFSVTPKLKHRLIYEKIESENTARSSYSDFIPIVMGQFSLTPKTSFQLGAQGLPLLPFKHWDRALKDNTFTQTDYLAMFRITADYFGIRDNSLFFGYQRTRRDFSHSGRPNFAQGVLFVELISPF